MGFLLAINGLLVFYIPITIVEASQRDNWEGRFEAITNYGLGRCSMAILGKTHGGNYIKGAKVGIYLVGKVDDNIPKYDLKDRTMIVDNVGDIIGMG